MSVAVTPDSVADGAAAEADRPAIVEELPRALGAAPVIVVVG